MSNERPHGAGEGVNMDRQSTLERLEKSYFDESTSRFLNTLADLFVECGTPKPTETDLGTLAIDRGVCEEWMEIFEGVPPHHKPERSLWFAIEKARAFAPAAPQEDGKFMSEGEKATRRWFTQEELDERIARVIAEATRRAPAAADGGKDTPASLAEEMEEDAGHLALNPATEEAASSLVHFAKRVARLSSAPASGESVEALLLRAAKMLRGDKQCCGACQADVSWRGHFDRCIILKIEAFLADRPRPPEPTKPGERKPSPGPTLIRGMEGLRDRLQAKADANREHEPLCMLRKDHTGPCMWSHLSAPATPATGCTYPDDKVDALLWECDNGGDAGIALAAKALRAARLSTPPVADPVAAKPAESGWMEKCNIRRAFDGTYYVKEPGGLLLQVGSRRWEGTNLDAYFPTRAAAEQALAAAKPPAGEGKP